MGIRLMINQTGEYTTPLENTYRDQNHRVAGTCMLWNGNRRVSVTRAEMGSESGMSIEMQTTTAE